MPQRKTNPEPRSTTEEKPPIRKAQPEYLQDQASPSMNESDYRRRKAKAPARKSPPRGRPGK